MLKSYLRWFETHHTERYRSGHNEAVLKTVCPQGRVGSNPTLSAPRIRNWILENNSEKYPSWPKGHPWKGCRSLIAARGFKSLLLRSLVSKKQWKFFLRKTKNLLTKQERCDNIYKLTEKQRTTFSLINWSWTLITEQWNNLERFWENRSLRTTKSFRTASLFKQLKNRMRPKNSKKI